MIKNKKKPLHSCTIDNCFFFFKSNNFFYTSIIGGGGGFESHISPLKIPGDTNWAIRLLALKQQFAKGINSHWILPRHNGLDIASQQLYLSPITTTLLHNHFFLIDMCTSDTNEVNYNVWKDVHYSCLTYNLKHNNWGYYYL